MPGESAASSLGERMRATMERYAMVRPGDHLGVAVSGGADSVALALLLKEVHSQLGIRLLLVHFNHQIRGADADADEAFVRDFAAAQELEFFAAREDVRTYALEQRCNLEEAGRRRRYAFFLDLLRQGRVTRVATAHTVDDQAETVLAQMLRGTSPAGLAGIYPLAGHVLRPLLHLRRAELRDFLAARAQPWREDRSNEDESRLRARIRRRLIPLLEADFQSGVVRHLASLAALAREDEAFWQDLVEERFKALVMRSEDRLTISVASLLNPLPVLHGQLTPESPSRGNDALPPAWTDLSPGHFQSRRQQALSARLLRRVFGELKGSRLGFTSQHVHSALRFAEDSTSGHRLELAAGIVIEKSFGELLFSRSAHAPRASCSPPAPGAQLPFSHLLPLDDTGGVVDVPEIGERLRLKVIDWPAAPRETNIQAIDWERLHAPLLVRNWRPGDAYRPQGRLRAHKLKELLRQQRVPLRQRAAWPVLTSAGRLVWARGLPVSEAFAAHDGTRKSVIVVEEPL